jgi:formylglycine-generating enzyme required for sulfatase activity
MRRISLIIAVFLIFFSCKKIERINPVDGIVGIEVLTPRKIDLGTLEVTANLDHVDEVPTVTQRGICWSSENLVPTTKDAFISQGSGSGTFTSTISGLKGNTVYFFRAFASNEKTTVYSYVKEFMIKAPYTNTVVATNIKSDGATLSGNVMSNSFDLIDFGVLWGSFPDLTYSNNKIEATSKTFSLDLKGLQSGKKYYFRTYANTNEGVAYGEELSFTTLGTNTPSLITTGVTNIGSTVANTGGEITSDGNLPIIDKGVCWSLYNDPTIEDNYKSLGSGSESFSTKLTNLVPITTYYVRAYARNSKGTSYGNEVSFTTSNTNTSTMINGVEFVNIPAGTFTMGSPSNEVDRSSDEQQHQVTLSAFKMSKNEITFTQYDAFCDATGGTKPDDSGWGRGNRPVINVTWYDAKAFADWMGCRLPTEAEWEYACRAGTTTPFNSGNNLTTNQANYDGNYPYNGYSKGVYLLKTQPVGSYPANAWGLNDMHGNVWEWCSDWYESNYGTNSQTNPAGPSSGSTRVYRGGGWFIFAQFCRSSYRDSNDPSLSFNRLGFRLVAP